MNLELERVGCGAFDRTATPDLSLFGLWVASLVGRDDTVSAVDVPRQDNAPAFAAYRATPLIKEIEGTEDDNLSRFDLSGLDRMSIEAHPSQVDAATHTAFVSLI